MKQIIFSTLFWCVVLTAFGQDQTIENEEESINKGIAVLGWKWNKLGLNAGIGFDQYSELKIQQMKQFAIEPNVIERDLTQYAETTYPNTSAPSFSLEFGFNPVFSTQREDKPLFLEREIILNLGGTFAKESYIEYQQEIPYSPDSSRIKSLGYCNLENELYLGAAYLFKLKYKGLGVYAGLGGNVGTTFANRFMFWEDEYINYRKIDVDNNGNYTYNETIHVKEVFENLEAVNSFYSRIYIPFGVECGIGKKLGVKIAGWIGKGYQHGFNQQNLTIRTTGNAYLGVNYRLP